MDIEQQDQPTEEQQIRKKLLRMLNFVVNEGETDDSPVIVASEIEQIVDNSGIDISEIEKGMNISLEGLKEDMWLPYLKRKVRELEQELEQEGVSCLDIPDILGRRLPFVLYLKEIVVKKGEDVSELDDKMKEFEKWAERKEPASDEDMFEEEF